MLVRTELAKVRKSISMVRASTTAGDKTYNYTDTMRIRDTFNLENMVIGQDVRWSNTTPYTKIVTMV